MGPRPFNSFTQTVTSLLYISLVVEWLFANSLRRMQIMSFGTKLCPPSAHTLAFSNSFKRRFTTWPARLPPSSWLWLPKILRTAQTPFTDEQTISNSQPVHLVCVSFWRVSSVRFSMLTYSPPWSHFMTTCFSLLVLMVRTTPSCS